MYTHGDATYSLSLTCVQKAALRALPWQTVMPDPGHKRRCSKWRRRVCTTAPTFSLTALQTLHPCCTSPAVPVQCRPAPRYASKGSAALHACPAGTGTAGRDSDSPGTEQSKRSLMSLLRPFIFRHLSKRTGIQVVNPAVFSIKSHFQVFT